MPGYTKKLVQICTWELESQFHSVAAEPDGLGLGYSDSWSNSQCPLGSAKGCQPECSQVESALTSNEATNLSNVLLAAAAIMMGAILRSRAAQQRRKDKGISPTFKPTSSRACSGNANLHIMMVAIGWERSLQNLSPQILGADSPQSTSSPAR